MATHVIVWEDLRGNAVTGLTPAFTIFRLAGNGNSLSPPTITEDGHGFYKFVYEVFEPIEVVVDGGVSIADPRVRYIRRALLPEQGETAAALQELLHHARNDLVFEVGSDGKTYQVLYLNDAPYRKWLITDQMGRPVKWPFSSQLPVNRHREF